MVQTSNGRTIIMTTGFRKLLVLFLAGGIFLLCNAWMVIQWMEDRGAIAWARHIREEYLTGTALTVIVVLLILLARPGSGRRWRSWRCSVCDHAALRKGNYCSECGSRA